ncbi:MAG: flagellar assembly protein FliW [Acidimicrobiia bacterium]
MIPEIVFDRGLPGFDLRRFALVEVSDESPVMCLRSLEDAAVEFVVAPPGLFFDDYDVDLDDDTVARLGLAGPEDALVLVIVNLHAGPREATANLLAPIVVNRRTRAAEQVVLTGALDDVSRSLVPA